jgi:hypothetical protein
MVLDPCQPQSIHQPYFTLFFTALFFFFYLALRLYETAEFSHDHSNDENDHPLHAITERYYHTIFVVGFLVLFADYFHPQEPSCQVASANEKTQQYCDSQ